MWESLSKKGLIEVITYQTDSGHKTFCYKYDFHSVDDVRSISLSLQQTHYKNFVDSNRVGRVEFIPVHWHTALHGDEGGVDEWVYRTRFLVHIELGFLHHENKKSFFKQHCDVHQNVSTKYFIAFWKMNNNFLTTEITLYWRSCIVASVNYQYHIKICIVFYCFKFFSVEKLFKWYR